MQPAANADDRKRRMAVAQRLIYYGGVIVWSLYVVLFPTWSGRIYHRDSRRPAVWHEGGVFGLSGHDFEQRAPLWNPPGEHRSPPPPAGSLSFSRGPSSVRWPWQAPSGNRHVELMLSRTLARWSVGIIVLGFIVSALNWLVPSDLQLQSLMAWGLSLSLGMAWLILNATPLVFIMTDSIAVFGYAIAAALGAGYGRWTYSRKRRRDGGPATAKARFQFSLGGILWFMVAVAVGCAAGVSAWRWLTTPTGHQSDGRQASGGQFARRPDEQPQNPVASVPVASAVTPEPEKSESKERAAPRVRNPSGPVLTLRGLGPIRAVAVAASAYRSTLMITATDNGATLWIAANGATQGSPLGFGRLVDVCLSADGHYAITHQFPYPSAKLLEWSPGSLALKSLPGPNFAPWAMALSTDGTNLAAVGNVGPDLLLRSYDLSTSDWRDAPFKPFQGYQCWPNAFSPDLHVLALLNGPDVAGERLLQFWETDTGKLLGTTRFEPGDRAVSLAFHPQGSMLAIAHEGPKMRAVNVPGGTTLSEFVLAEPLSKIVFHASGELVACVGRESGNVELRDAHNGELRRLPKKLAGAATAAFSPDGRYLFVGNRDGTATLWELDGEE